MTSKRIMLSLLTAFAIGFVLTFAFPPPKRANAQVSGPTTRTPYLTVDGALSAGSATVGGSAVCRADGVNCPSVSSTDIFCSAGTECDGAGLPVGSSVFIYKPSATSRASTTTFAIDPHLYAVNLPAGSYTYHLSMNWSESGSASGFRIRPIGGVSTDGLASLGSCDGVTTTLIVPVGGTGLCGGTTSIGYHVAYGYVAAAGALSTIGLQWAQRNSNVNATNLGVGSQLVITRVQ